MAKTEQPEKKTIDLEYLQAQAETSRSQLHTVAAQIAELEQQLRDAAHHYAKIEGALELTEALIAREQGQE